MQKALCVGRWTGAHSGANGRRQLGLSSTTCAACGAKDLGLGRPAGAAAPGLKRTLLDDGTDLLCAVHMDHKDGDIIACRCHYGDCSIAGLGPCFYLDCEVCKPRTRLYGEDGRRTEMAGKEVELWPPSMPMGNDTIARFEGALRLRNHRCRASSTALSARHVVRDRCTCCHCQHVARAYLPN
mgnify:FL=1